MNRVAIFVDAGYLFAQGSVALTGNKQHRPDLILDKDAAINALKAAAITKAPAATLLRIYWYDGVSYRGPSAEQASLAHTDDLKMRLGLVNSAGQQKGVDSMIVIDLLDLGRNHAISDAVLLSGDEDVRIGVQMAQHYGVRVHLIGITPSRGSQSRQLLQEADTTIEWDKATVAQFLSVRPALGAIAAPTLTASTTAPHAAAKAPAPVKATAATSSTPSPSNPLENVAIEVTSSLNSGDVENIKAFWKTQKGVPPEFDGKLLARSRAALGRDLDVSEKRLVRTFFGNEVKKRIKP